VTSKTSAPGELTGRKVAAIFVAFFGVVMAVNFTMASFASSTFGGVVVENSYVASQKYNGWLESARQQRKLGWDPMVSRTDDGRVMIRIAGEAAGFGAIGRARHPLGRAPDQALDFTAGPDGGLVSTRPLPAGRWLVRFELRQGGKLYRDEQEIR
jgi:nitrogen fixation protein FixH